MRRARRAACCLLVSYCSCLSFGASFQPPIRPATLTESSASDPSFELAVTLCKARNKGWATSLSPAVPRLLRETFDNDFARLMNTGTQRVQNVTCLQPEAGASGMQRFDDDLLAVPLQPGRVCEDGDCCDACSRVLLPDFATREECDDFRASFASLIPPSDELPHFNLYLGPCAAAGDVRTTLIFVRLIERMRRYIAHEYGLCLARVTPRQTFISRICDAAEVERQSLHADESSFASFHYSCVLYLSSMHEDFLGGGFAFSDPPSEPEAVARGERVLQRLEPIAGSAVVFSSGWENMHIVEPLEAGNRFAIPAFFVTKAEANNAAQSDVELARSALEAYAGADAAAIDRVCDKVARAESQSDEGGEAEGEEAIAEALWRGVLMPDSEQDFRDFMGRWHELLAAPLASAPS